MKPITRGETIQSVNTNKQVGNSNVHEKTVVKKELVDQKEFALAKANQILWFGVHLIGIVIALRFVFLLFSARLTGFSLLIYNLSAPFVRPFQGIFPAPQTGGSYFDSAAILALAMWYVFGFIISYLLGIFSNNTTETP